jgi:uncharacterized membrane protein
MGGLWLFDAIINEYRGWRRFREATETWPVCSILASIFSIPLLFGMGLLCFVAALRVGTLWLAVSALFFLVVGAAAAWWGLRRLACTTDVRRALRSGGTNYSPLTLEEFLR